MYCCYKPIRIVIKSSKMLYQSANVWKSNTKIDWDFRLAIKLNLRAQRKKFFTRLHVRVKKTESKGTQFENSHGIDFYFYSNFFRDANKFVNYNEDLRHPSLPTMPEYEDEPQVDQPKFVSESANCTEYK